MIFFAPAIIYETALLRFVILLGGDVFVLGLTETGIVIASCVAIIGHIGKTGGRVLFHLGAEGFVFLERHQHLAGLRAFVFAKDTAAAIISMMREARA